MLERARISERVQRINGDLEHLAKADATAQSCEEYFPKFYKDLGEVYSMIIGPLRQACMGHPPGTLRFDVELSGFRLERKKLGVVGGQIQYHWEMYSRSIESVSELVGNEGLK